MPYIEPAIRQRMDLGILQPTTAGELNYAITRMCLKYIKHPLNYSHINELVGVLECAKLELYRRLAAPYEDRKIAENGDVYPQ